MTCVADSDLILIPAGESVQLLPLSRLSGAVAFLTDSYDYVELLLIEPQLPPVTDATDKVILGQVTQSGTIVGEVLPVPCKPIRARRSVRASGTVVGETAPVKSKKIKGRVTAKKT